MVALLNTFGLSYEPISIFGPCTGVGLASKAQVAAALAEIFRKTNYQPANCVMGIDLIPLPQFPALQTNQLGPLLVRVKPIPTQKAGAVIRWAVEVSNPTNASYDLSWGDASLDYVLLDAQGQPVRWLNKNFFNMYGAFTQCPPQSVCTPDLALRDRDRELRLRSLVADRPLPAGTYTLRVNVKDTTLGGQTFNITLPDVTFEVVR
ncbi:hypothetical protein Dxin01_01057 [Deinococcus xinjiangensis]|uniref:Intracellular proteinase inhibitor BsuPI domain-containing protein n=1 Tax=Deinococcus xinjiangensis TaxID=457454 RepID=A0ABP9V9Y2_9DEIO